MTEDWWRALLEGFLGAIAGGAIAAVIALRTTKAATRADAAARDRDRRLEAALRFRKFVSSYGTATRKAFRSGGFELDPQDAESLRDEAYIALKSAQFALHGDSDFKAWLVWLHDRINEQVRDGALRREQSEWIGKIANIIEGRLFDGADLEYHRRPTPHVEPGVGTAP